MVFEQRQLAEIWVKETESRGTGYLLCPGCLLTAKHVVEGCSDTGVSFRLLCREDIQNQPASKWPKSSQIWSAQNFDIALIFFDATEQNSSLIIPRIARLESEQTILVQVCGFPAFAQVEGRYRDYPLKGKLTPFDSLKTPALAKFKIQDEVPSSGMKAWKGFSGSPVFTDSGLLAGIVTQGFEEFRGEILEVLAIGWLLDHHPVGQELLSEVIKFSGIEIVCRSLTTAEVPALPLEQQLIPATAFPRPETTHNTGRDEVRKTLPEEFAALGCEEDPGTVYLVIAVFWHQRTPPSFKVSPQLSYRDLKTDEVVTKSLMKENCNVTEADFPKFLNGIIQFTTPQLSKLFPDPLMPWKLTIALFIPVELLGNPLTDWCGTESSILQDRVLVLGCSDRFNPDNPSRSADLHNSLKQGWRNFQRCSPDGRGISLQVLNWLDSRKPNDLSVRWENYAGLKCYGNWLKPGTEYQSYWQKLIQTGIPLALWMSESQLDEPTTERCFSGLISCNRFEFLEKVREIRQAQHQADSGAGTVGVLYEDPRYTPPEPQVEEDFFSWPGT